MVPNNPLMRARPSCVPIDLRTDLTAVSETDWRRDLRAGALRRELILGTVKEPRLVVLALVSIFCCDSSASALASVRLAKTSYAETRSIPLS